MTYLRSLLFAAAALNAVAGAQTGTTGSRVEPQAQYSVPLDDLLYASPTRLDHIGRIVAPVMINGQGPFRFIVDTGASRSTVSPQLARRLDLVPAADLPIQVRGITGTAQVPSVVVRKLQAGDLLIENMRFPVVWAPLMAGADGVLGIAGLKDKCISVDFVHNRVTIRRSGGGITPRGFDRVPGRLLEDGVMVIDARIAGVRVAAVIDTGSERTIANNALRDALSWRRRPGDMTEIADVYGATADVGTGQMEIAPTIDFGRIKISNVTLVYGDFPIFQVWGLESRPAVIIGMDILGTVNALSLDFQRDEFYVDSVFHLG